jgi:exopolysaccharide/PEP-CTERM locus tyrosine autokinase
MSGIIERALKGRGIDSTGPKPPKVLRPVSGPQPANGTVTASRGPEFAFNMGTLERAGFLTPASVQSTLAEEFRLLKRPVLSNAMGRGAAPVERGNIVAVTSALPHEGKTFTSMNLAMSIAQERDHTVLLVDSDLIQRSLTRFLGVLDVPGLTDVLGDGSLDLASVIGRTSVPKLRVMACGRSDPLGTELLASEQMVRVVTELSRRYPDRLVIFDAPPLLSTSQAVVLANLAGQVLVVVEEGRTSQANVQEALGLLDESKVIGMVLNKSVGRTGRDYYGGYYGGASEASTASDPGDPGS